jgi:AI-2 transport protein TqsA
VTIAADPPVTRATPPPPHADSGNEGTSVGGLPRALVILLGMAALVVVVAGVRAVAWLIGPAFMALMIVIAVAPVQGWMHRRGWPGWAATLVLIICVYGLLLLLALGMIFSVARLATELPQYASKADTLVSSATSELARWGVGPDQLKQAASSLNPGKLAGLLAALLGSVAGLATNLVFLLALLLFLSVESSGVGARLASIAADRPRVTEALAHFAWGTRQYLLVTTVFGFIVAVLDTIALWILGIPLPITWGILAFITNYIPNIGFVIGVVPPALLGLLTGGVQLLVIVVVVYCVLNSVIQSVIQPRFIGDAVGLSITVTFVALVFWAWLLGPLGAILAIPLTILAKDLLVDIDPRARWADALLRSTPTGPDVPADEGAAPKQGDEAQHGPAESRGSVGVPPQTGNGGLRSREAADPGAGSL